MPGSHARQPAPDANLLDLRAVAEAMRNLSERAELLDGPPLEQLVQMALDLVPGAHSASVTMLRRGHFSTEAASDEVATRADALQYAIGAGPCVDSVLERPLYVTGDVRKDPRWVTWGRRVSDEVGVRSVLAQRLHLHEQPDPIAALNLYSPETDEFDAEAVGVALILATHAAVVVSQNLAVVRAKNLLRALESNREIGMAMGILMEKDHLTRAQAFDVLRVASQDANRKLVDIAVEVADTGVLEIRRRPPRETGHRPAPGATSDRRGGHRPRYRRVMSREPADDKVSSRAELLPEEQAAGSDAPEEQARAILAESLERTEHPEATRRESTQTPD